MATSAPSRARALSPQTPLRRPTKRSYADMDDEDSDASEYMPTKKGKRRLRAATEVRNGCVEAESEAPGRHRRERDEQSGGRKSAAVADSKRPITPTEARLEAALKEVADLRSQLARAKEAAQQDVMKARQDQVLHHGLADKRLATLEQKYRKVGSQLKIAQGRVVELEGAKKANLSLITELDKSLGVANQEVSKCKGEREYWQQESEHYQSLIAMAEDDLTELRRIENEDRAKQARAAEKDALPPAYGSLPDEDNGIEEAHDSGQLEVASFKRIVRSSFMAILARAQQTWDGVNSLPNRTLTQKARADSELVLALASALAEAASNITDVLTRSQEVRRTVITHSKVADNDPIERESEVRRQNARQEYIADRFAKLVLDLIVRALAALELRPLSTSLTAQERTNVNLAWSAVDECLLKAIRAIFNTGHASTAIPSQESDPIAAAKVTPATTSTTRNETLFNLQYYTTHLSLLQSRLDLWKVASALGDRGWGFERRLKYFGQTDTWLQERVEAERMIGAGVDDGEGVGGSSGTPAAPVGGTGRASDQPLAVPHLSTSTLAARRAAATLGGVGSIERAALAQADAASTSRRGAAREIILNARAGATQRRIGMHRRASLHSHGSTPNGSQRSATAAPGQPRASRSVDNRAQTPVRFPSDDGDLYSDISMSSEPSLEPSDIDYDNVGQIQPSPSPYPDLSSRLRTPGRPTDLERETDWFDSDVDMDAGGGAEELPAEGA